MATVTEHLAELAEEQRPQSSPPRAARSVEFEAGRRGASSDDPPYFFSGISVTLMRLAELRYVFAACWTVAASSFL